MAPFFSLRPRVEEPPQSGLNLSNIAIAGIAVISVAAIGLVILIAVLFIRRRKRYDSEDGAEDTKKVSRTVHLQQLYIEKEPLPADLQAIKPSSGLSRSVSRRNITPSIILPSPVPPVAAARPRPHKVLEPPVTLTRLSSAEIVAHHQATGTTPRPFTPLPAHMSGPFSFALNASPAPPSLPHFPNNPGMRNSVVSFSRLSILSGSFRSLSLRNSLASASTVTGVAPEGAELLKVRHVFTPLLPDELVLRSNEKVTLIQAYDDGWSVVGRKSAFSAKPPLSPAAYAFGQGKNACGSADEVEIGAVPSWVFDKRAKMVRPMRSSSLGVTLVLEEGERGAAVNGVRDDVISWSNF